MKILKQIYMLSATVIVLYAGWLVTRIFLFDQFITPTESMIPTLLPGDRVVVNKMIVGARIYTDLDFNPEGGVLKAFRTRGWRKVMPNDIVVFNFPHHDGKINFVINNVYAKRCVAIPGDTLTIREVYFHNNNFKGVIVIKDCQDALAAMPDSLLPPFVIRSMPFDDSIRWTIKNLGPLYVPRKGDIVTITPDEACIYRMILEWETGKTISFDRATGSVFAGDERINRHVFTHNYYFMCGDNVVNSNDSRYWGFVPEEYIVGVVSRITYSIDPETGKYSKDRFMKQVKGWNAY